MNDNEKSESVDFDIIEFFTKSIGKLVKVSKDLGDFEGVLDKYTKVTSEGSYGASLDFYLLYVKRLNMWFVEGRILDKGEEGAKATSGKEDISRIIPYNPLMDIITRIDEQRFDKEE